MGKLTVEVTMEFEFMLQILDRKNNRLGHRIIYAETFKEAIEKAETFRYYMERCAPTETNFPKEWEDEHIAKKIKRDLNGMYTITLEIVDMNCPQFQKAEFTYTQGNRTDTWCAYPDIVETVKE